MCHDQSLFIPALYRLFISSGMPPNPIYFVYPDRTVAFYYVWFMGLRETPKCKAVTVKKSYH